VSLGAAAADAVLGGLRRGALHEVFAVGEVGVGAASGFAAGLAARAGGMRPLLWVRQDFVAREYGALHGPGLLELGLDPGRVILVKAPDALAVLRVAQEAVACAALGAIIAEIHGAPRILDLTASRRLVLAAAKTGVTPILLRHPATPLPCAAETRWLVASAPSAGEAWGWPRLAVTLFRNRHGGVGEFLLSWREGRFHDATPDSRALVSAPADRPPQAPFRHSA
jgi:protein ImuA